MLGEWSLEANALHESSSSAPYAANTHDQICTSMAAADVSGVLALIEDYFTNQFQPSLYPALR